MSSCARLILLVFYLLFVSRISHSYIPSPRGLSSSTLVGQKIYFLGGFLPPFGSITITNDFFYLDCTSPFDKTKGVPFTDLSYLPRIPSIAGAGATIFGPNRNEIFIFGGVTRNNSFGFPIIYLFDEKKYNWSSYNATVVDRQNTKPILSSGKVFIFGGTLKNGYYQYMDILNIADMSWSNGSLNGAPSARDGYAAILTSDGTIIYFGGWSNHITAEMNLIYLYNTKTDSWRFLTTVGEDLESRAHFSSVLAKDGKGIIIYGGENQGSVDLPARDASVTLAKLDISAEPFRWIIPNISGDPPPPLVGHNAHVIGDFMILAFGYSHTSNSESGEIYILDISDDSEYKWVSSFSPTNSSVTSPTVSSSPTTTQTATPSSIAESTSSSSSSSNKVKIIASVFGSIFVVLVIFVIYYLYRRKNRYTLRIPGTYYEKSSEVEESSL